MELQNIKQNYSISKYRTPLMGFAMIWVMLYHLPINFSYLEPIKSIGYLGVDIFMFLSSYGLYYGFQKDNQCIKRFYKKRILRILPSYYFLIGLGFFCNVILYSKPGMIHWLQVATMLGFFFPPLNWPLFLWYIPAILTLYIIFPLIYKNLHFVKKYLLIIILFILSCNILSQTYTNSFALQVFIPRIIPFILGAIWANIEKYNFNRTNALIVSIIGIIGLLIIYIARKELSEYYRILFMLDTFPFIFALPLCCFLFSTIYEYAPILIQKIISYAGKYSLELYLIHPSLYNCTTKITNHFQITNYYLFPITLLMCFIIAYYFNCLIKYILTITNLKSTIMH